MYSQKNESVKSFINIINTSTFKADLLEAKQNPEGIKAKKIVQKLSPHIKLTGNTVPFGPVERQKTKYQLYAMNQHFGYGSYFATTCPDDINSPYA